MTAPLPGGTAAIRLEQAKRNEELVLAENAQRWSIAKTCPSLDKLCESDVDAVAIITQHWLHGSQAIAALEAAKDVYSAVPAA